ncbi:MAG: hypothetical protein CMQ24_16130 [Gammaproteobacteria bacterium]|nr:hypothetical protein [Gammaproteobacteria bacterium]
MKGFLMNALRMFRQDDTPEAPAAPVTESPKRRLTLRGIVQLGLVLAFIAAAVVFSRAPTEEDIARPAGPPAGAAGVPRGAPGQTGPLVRIVSPAAATSTLSVSATGAIAVRGYVDLTPQVGGQVTEISPQLREGGEFSARQTLLRIDRRDFDLALEAANADVDTARSSLLLREAEGDAAVDNYRILHPNKPVPPLVAKVPQIEQAKAQLAAATARANTARLDLSRTTFALPFDGYITASSAEVGQVLTRGQPFGQAFSREAVEAAVPLAPRDVETLSPLPGRSARLRAGDVTLAAEVERVAPELDPRTRFARIFLALEAPLPPGTFVDVEIDGPPLPDTFVLPEAAEQLGSFFWVVRDGQLEMATPQILGRSDDGIVTAAFDTGEGVVLGSVPGARTGLSVQTSAAE